MGLVLDSAGQPPTLYALQIHLLTYLLTYLNYKFCMLVLRVKTRAAAIEEFATRVLVRVSYRLLEYSTIPEVI